MKRYIGMIVILSFAMALSISIIFTNLTGSKEETPVEEPKQEKPVEKVPEEEIPKEEPVPEVEEPQEPEIILTPQELARIELVEKYGEEVVDAWERLSRDEFFDYIGYEMIIKEQHSLYGDVYYHCYKILEDGSMEDANVGGNYYIYGIFVSNEAMFDLIDYHNEFFAVK